MSHAATLHDDQPTVVAGASVLISALVMAWVGLIFWLGATSTFVAAAGAPPLHLLAAVLGAVLAFLVAYRVSPVVRAYALRADLRFVTATQAWRFGGFTFLALYTYNVLPGYFAWPAGLGDMAIGAAAPWMLVGLARERGFAASRRFVTWNVLGILDLVVAVSTGAVVPLLFPHVINAIPTGAMTRLPLVLIPGFFVPAYIILHVVALAQARRAVSEGESAIVRDTRHEERNAMAPAPGSPRGAKIFVGMNRLISGDDTTPDEAVPGSDGGSSVIDTSQWS